MHPANDFVRDFVGADRALKRLALMRVRDVDLWSAGGGRPSSSSWTPTRRAVDGLARPARRPVDARARRSTATTSCATRCPTSCCSETQYGAVVDAAGRLAGILSVELIHDFLAPEAVGSTNESA